jgi:hypothetical protein
MKNIILTLIVICSFSVSNAQSKKEIIQELTIENANLKQEISILNDKITSLNGEITSLKKELVVDKIETPQEYGKTLFDLFVSQRLSKYPELQFQLKDTIYLKAKDVETMKESIKKIQNNSLDFYLQGMNNGIDWSKVKFENFDFEINEPNGDIEINHLRGKFYFNYLGKKYRFRNEASILENGKWRGYIFNDLVNVSLELEKEKKEEQERLNEPYKPIGLRIAEDYLYSAYKSDPKHLSSLKISFENKTNNTINWVKFRLKIGDDGEIIVSKNITLNEYNGFDSNLEPGEKEVIEIQDLGDIFIKSGVMNKNWWLVATLIEAGPKPLED